MKSLSRVQPSATPWTAAFQAPPSMGFSRQEYWSGVPLPCVKEIASGKLLNNTEPSLELCDDLEAWDGGAVEMEAQEGGYIYMCVCVCVCLFI